MTIYLALQFIFFQFLYSFFLFLTNITRFYCLLLPTVSVASRGAVVNKIRFDIHGCVRREVQKSVAKIQYDWRRPLPLAETITTGN